MVLNQVFRRRRKTPRKAKNQAKSLVYAYFGAKRRGRTTIPAAVQVHCDYSHSIVAGGLDDMSYTTRLIPRTSLIMRLEIAASVS